MFSKGDNVEAVDIEKQWARGKVVKVIEQGRYEVKFDGWSTRWNREVGEEDIRKCTDAVLSGSRKRKVCN